MMDDDDVGVEAFYNDDDKARFKSYFIVPKRKPGRPRKRKRGRPAGKRKTDEKESRTAQLMIDGGAKQVDNLLDARLEATIKASRARSKVRTAKCRINWDKEPHYSLRQRIADSWILKKDLWMKGETLRKFCERMNMSRPVLHRYLSKRKQELKDGIKSKASKRGRKTHLSESVMRHVCEGGWVLLCCCMLVHRILFKNYLCIFAVIKRHDDQSEGLTRSEIIDVVRSASGWTLTKAQATHTWDDSIHKFGKKAVLLCGYVKPQQGTSKRTAAGSVKLQKRWHITIDALFKRVLDHNTILVGLDKAKKLMSHLVFNLDEECLMATGKNIKIVGSRDKKKHDNEKGSSRDSITNIR